MNQKIDLEAIKYVFSTICLTTKNINIINKKFKEYLDTIQEDGLIYDYMIDDTYYDDILRYTIKIYPQVFPSEISIDNNSIFTYKNEEK